MPKVTGRTRVPDRLCLLGLGAMKDINDLLLEKEAELQQLEKEIKALRLAASLLNEKGSSSAAGIVAVASPKIPASAPASEERTSEITVSGAPTSRQFP